MTLTPADMAKLEDVRALFSRFPRYVLWLRSLVLKGSKHAGKIFRTEIDNLYGVDADEIDVLLAYGLLMRYIDHPATHPMSAAPPSALSLSPLALAYLNAIHEEMEADGRKGLLSLAIHPERLENPQYTRVRTDSLSLYIHGAALRVARLPVKEPEITRGFRRHEPPRRRQA